MSKRSSMQGERGFNQVNSEIRARQKRSWAWLLFAGFLGPKDNELYMPPCIVSTSSVSRYLGSLTVG